jgi:TetR/AcrR family transcriptional repressor of nem operon
LAHVAEKSPPETAWKTIVKTYLSPEHCDHAECGCPLAALAPELARVDQAMKGQILELTKYKNRMVPFMPGRRAADKERNFLVIFSTMLGAIGTARILPDRAAPARVLASTRELFWTASGALHMNPK